MNQAESVVEFAVGIGKTREVVEVIRREKFGGAVFSAKVDKGDARTLGFELRTKFGELGDRLATEGSTKVAEKDQQERVVDRKRVDGFAGLRAVGLQELGSDLFGSEHGLSPFAKFGWSICTAGDVTSSSDTREVSYVNCLTSCGTEAGRV